jgi:hypothetical protein
MYFFYRLRHILFPYKTTDLEFMNIHSVIFISIIEIPEIGGFETIMSKMVRFEKILHKCRLFRLYQLSKCAVCCYVICYSHLLLLSSILY